MKRLILLATLLPLLTTTIAQTRLRPGDIIITGFNSTDPDVFTFVPLVDLAVGTPICFTDNGWHTTNGFRKTEGILNYTAPVGGVKAGTVVHYYPDAPNFNKSNNLFLLSMDGDQLISYQIYDEDNELADPNMGGVAYFTKFVFALTFKKPWGEAISSNTSAIPPGLKAGETALELGNYRNFQYKVSAKRQGQLHVLLRDVCNPNNWFGSNGLLTMDTTPFSLSKMMPGDVALIAVNASVVGLQDFAFTALKQIPAGTEMFFTDNGWNGYLGFRKGEGTLLYTVPQGGLSPGKVVVYRDNKQDFKASGNFNLEMKDQLLVYEGLESHPSFIFGLCYGTGWQENANSNSTSVRPHLLVDGINAVALADKPNQVFDQCLATDLDNRLASICQPGNWKDEGAIQLNLALRLSPCVTGMSGCE